MSNGLVAHLHGFSYVLQDGDKVITIEGQDGEPYYTETIPVIEAAALTFQKAPATAALMKP